MSLQEKFQITIPGKREPDEQWVDSTSQRNTTGVKRPFLNQRFNEMPVGYDASSIKDEFTTVFDGSQDVSNGMFTDTNLAKGFQPLNMKGDDDQYTGEHVDHFYGIAYGDDGEEGFAERNNMCDRI